jgi:ATP-dependent HslUV protease ATP-binding subunit HslU
MGTEDVSVSFSEDGIKALAQAAAEVNRSVENIGARRLYTVIERVFEQLSFAAPDQAGSKVVIDKAYVDKHLDSLLQSTDLSRYVL